MKNSYLSPSMGKRHIRHVAEVRVHMHLSQDFKSLLLFLVCTVYASYMH